MAELVEQTLAKELTDRGVISWLLAHPSNPLWRERTPEEEIARIAIRVLEAAGYEITRACDNDHRWGCCSIHGTHVVPHAGCILR